MRSKGTNSGRRRREWWVRHRANWFLGSVFARTIRGARRAGVNRWRHWRGEMYAVAAGAKDHRTAENSF